MNRSLPTFTKSTDIVLERSIYTGHQDFRRRSLRSGAADECSRIRLKCKGEAVLHRSIGGGIRRKFSTFENYLHVETYLVLGVANKCQTVIKMYIGQTEPLSMSSMGLPVHGYVSLGKLYILR